MNEQQEEQINETGNETVPLEIEENENTEPSEPMIFGMPAFYFRGAALGVAVGYILSGVIGLILQYTVSANISAIVGGAIGYLTAKFIRKKRQEKQKTEE